MTYRKFLNFIIKKNYLSNQLKDLLLPSINQNF